MTDKGPDTPSSDYQAMEPYWDMVSAIMGGTDTMKKAGKAYLPKFPYEPTADYDIRLANARFTNIFGDIVDTLSSKPFEKELIVQNADAIKDYLEDVDGHGNHIHVFGANVFQAAVAEAITWVLVDYSKNVPAGATLADEKNLGARPYFVHIPACRLLAVYSERIRGKDVIVHARIEEETIERVGWEEKEVERVRVINRDVVRNELGEAIEAGPPTWELFEERKDENNKEIWVSVGSGEYSIGYIPLYPLITGKRKGSSWVIRPALQSAAHLQIEHYQQENELKHIRQSAAFPMLAGNGVSPDVGDDGKPKPIPTGPFSVLYAPMGGDGKFGQWDTIEPQGTSLTFCSAEIDKTEAQLRELGRQPLTAQSGNITTITAAFAGDKAHTVIEAWALNFKDFMENCLKAMAEWVKVQVEPEVEVNTDFSLALYDNTGMDSLDKARDRQDISQETWFDEAKRRGYIGPNRTFEDEVKRLASEMPGDATDLEQDAAMGLPNDQNVDPQAA